MKVGVSISRIADMDDVRAQVDRLENAGLDSVWFPDHLLGYYHPAIWDELPGVQPPSGAAPDAQRFDADAWLDPFCMAGMLAQQTKLPLGTCVTDGTRRRGADLLRSMLTLNNWLPGGFKLGIGAGEYMSLQPMGYDAKRLLTNLEVTLSELRSLLDTGRMPDGSGRVGLDIDGPNGRPEVWVAGGAPRTLRLAGEYGDGWFHLSVSADLYRQQLEAVAQAAAAAGRPTPMTSLVPLVMLGDSRDEVIEAMESSPGIKSVAMMLPAAVWEAFGVPHPAGPECRGVMDLCPLDVDPEVVRETMPKVPIELVEQFMMLGNSEEIGARLEPFIEAGIRDIVFTDVTVTVHPPERVDELHEQYGHLATLLRETATVASA